MANPDASQAFYTISVISRMLGVHPQTLRMYERQGLVKPSRSQGNTRLYAEEDLEAVREILTLTRDMGVNLAGVEIVLRLRRQIESMQHEFADLIEFIQKEMAREYQDFDQKFASALVKAPAHGTIRLVKIEHGRPQPKNKRS